jgi:hypothetical protein
MTNRSGRVRGAICADVSRTAARAPRTEHGEHSVARRRRRALPVEHGKVAAGARRNRQRYKQWYCWAIQAATAWDAHRRSDIAVGPRLPDAKCALLSVSHTEHPQTGYIREFTRALRARALVYVRRAPGYPVKQLSHSVFQCALSGVDRTQRSARAGCGLGEHVHRRLLSTPRRLCVGELATPQCPLHPGHADAVPATRTVHRRR